MNQPYKNMSCAEFSSRMAQLIASGEELSAHPHVRSCKLHRALLKDLEAIAEAAKQLFPEVEPRESLWDGISGKLAIQEESSPTVVQVAPGYRLMFALEVAEGIRPDRISAGPLGLARANATQSQEVQAQQVKGPRPVSRREGRR
jgi:hypothetical protein